MSLSTFHLCTIPKPPELLRDGGRGWAEHARCWPPPMVPKAELLISEAEVGDEGPQAPRAGPLQLLVCGTGCVLSGSAGARPTWEPSYGGQRLTLCACKDGLQLWPSCWEPSLLGSWRTRAGCALPRKFLAPEGPAPVPHTLAGAETAAVGSGWRPGDVEVRWDTMFSSGWAAHLWWVEGHSQVQGRKALQGGSWLSVLGLVPGLPLSLTPRTTLRRPPKVLFLPSFCFL